MQKPSPGLKRSIAILIIAGFTIAGCSSQDSLTQESTRQQIEQQKLLTKQQTDLAKASQELVAADARARLQITQLQSKLQTDFQTERKDIGQQRDALEQDRRDIAQYRHRDPLIAAALANACSVLVALLPILLLIQLLKCARDEPSDVPVTELLICDLVAENPMLPRSVDVPIVSASKALPQESSSPKRIL